MTNPGDISSVETGIFIGKPFTDDTEGSKVIGVNLGGFFRVTQAAILSSD